jgi:hypothetical protein
VLELGKLEFDEIATALQDQNDWDHCWLIDPRSGEVGFRRRTAGRWPHAGRPGGAGPDPDRAVAVLGLVPGHGRLRRGRLRSARPPQPATAIEGKGAFGRFKDRLHQNYPDLLPASYAFQSVRAKRRAVQWLVDSSLVDPQAAGCPGPVHRPRPALNRTTDPVTSGQIANPTGRVPRRIGQALPAISHAIADETAYQGGDARSPCPGSLSEGAPTWLPSEPGPVPGASLDWRRWRWSSS